jgi:2,3-bisphosphoglycerate-dependent phosphoglycerate mutase
MQLYFIRHGQSTNNELWERMGPNRERSEDPELTTTGRMQAAALAQYLSQMPSLGDTPQFDNQNIGGFGITHLYCSLMVRAVATGTTISETLDLPLVAWEEIHEGGGIYLDDPDTGEKVGRAGRNRAYFEEHFPGFILPQSMDGDGWWNRPFEEREQRYVRARCFLDELAMRHSGTEDRVAIVSHAGFYNYLLAELLGLPQRSGYWFSLNNTAITRIDFRPEDVGLVYLNRLDFLPRELVT